MKVGISKVAATVLLCCTTALAGAAEAAVDWQANWIFTHQWGRSAPPYNPENLFAMFRKTFDLPAGVSEAKAHVFADPRYQLFVNGRRVGRGPVRGEAYWFYYDSYDLGPFLRAGRNTVSVLVNSFGDHGLGWYVPPPESPVRGALLFQADVKLNDGRKTTIASDPSWRFHRHQAWQQGTPRVNNVCPFIEFYDARLEPQGWTTADFDDSAWRQAVVLLSSTGLSKPPMEPFVHLLPRPIPALIEEEVWPERVLATGETDAQVSTLEELAERTTREPHYPARDFRFELPRSLRSDPLVIDAGTAASEKTRAPFAIIDFGRQVVGYLRLEVEAPAGTVIDIAFSESLLDGRVNATSPGGRYVARYIAREGRQSWERFDWYGFQYVQFTFRNFNRPIRFKTSLNFSTFPLGKGSFSSSDPLLNRIWETARYTLQLCTWDRFLDVTQREQRQYLGDGQLEVLAHYALNGELSIVRKFFQDGARTQRSDGLLRQYTGGRSGGPDIIPDYNFSWIDALADHYLYTGDRELVLEVYPTLVKCLDWFLGRVDEDGLLGPLPYWLFLDFSAPDRRGKSSILNARFYYSLNEAAKLAKLVGDSYRAQLWTRAASRIGQSFNGRFWDESRGVYVDAWVDGKPSPYIGQYANGMAILASLVPADKIGRILNAIYDPKRVQVVSQRGFVFNLAMDPPPRPPDFDIRSGVVKPQPHGFHFVMLALAKIKRYDLQIAEVKERFGALLDQGATAFWGNWEPTNTLAAGWSSTPAYYFATTLLGIRPVEPGFTRFAVEPRLAGPTWVKGSFPSVKGEIPVSWNVSGNEFRLDSEAPPETQAELLIPVLKTSPRLIRFNGREIWRDGNPVRDETVAWIRAEEDGVRLSPAQPGRYNVTAVY